MHRTIRIGAAFGAIAVAALVLFASVPATAHGYLTSSTPAEGETLTELPKEFSLTTNETLLDLTGDGGGFAIQVTNAAGQHFGDGCFSIRDQTLSTGATLGEAGDYLMRWQLVSADGHTISGEIGFEWQPALDQTISQGLDAPPACGGGTLDDAAPIGEGTATPGDEPAGASPQVDTPTVVLIATAITLILVTAVAIFLISVKRQKRGE